MKRMTVFLFALLLPGVVFSSPDVRLLAEPMPENPERISAYVVYRNVFLYGGGNAWKLRYPAGVCEVIFFPDGKIALPGVLPVAPVFQLSGELLSIPRGEGDLFDGVPSAASPEGAGASHVALYRFEPADFEVKFLRDVPAPEGVSRAESLEYGSRLAEALFAPVAEVPRQVPEDFKAEYTARVTDVTARRGFPGGVQDQDGLRKQAAEGVNLVGLHPGEMLNELLDEAVVRKVRAVLDCRDISGDELTTLAEKAASHPALWALEVAGDADAARVRDAGIPVPLVVSCDLEMFDRQIPMELADVIYAVPLGKLPEGVELREALRPVTDFQERYGVRIWVKEFPAGEESRRKLIDFFESRHWDWSGLPGPGKFRRNNPPVQR